MPYLTELDDVLRDAGLPVVEVPGWELRGHGAMGSILGVLCHHTAGPSATSKAGLAGGRWPAPPAPARLTIPGYPSLNTVVEGRPGLAGPLCNLALTRLGVWVVVAAGQGWHAGTGGVSWCTSNGNAHLIGIEAESTGVNPADWTTAQREAYPRGVAALLSHYRLGSYRCIGHKEWSPGRKVDPANWDMGTFRADVARWMNAPTRPAPPQEDPMAAVSDADMALIIEASRSVLFGKAGVRQAGELALAVDNLTRSVNALDARVARVERDLAVLAGRPLSSPSGTPADG